MGRADSSSPAKAIEMQARAPAGSRRSAMCVERHDGRFEVTIGTVRHRPGREDRGRQHDNRNERCGRLKLQESGDLKRFNTGCARPRFRGAVGLRRERRFRCWRRSRASVCSRKRRRPSSDRFTLRYALRRARKPERRRGRESLTMMVWRIASKFQSGTWHA